MQNLNYSFKKFLLFSLFFCLTGSSYSFAPVDISKKNKEKTETDNTHLPSDLKKKSTKKLTLKEKIRRLFQKKKSKRSHKKKRHNTRKKLQKNDTRKVEPNAKRSFIATLSGAAAFFIPVVGIALLGIFNIWAIAFANESFKRFKKSPGKYKGKIWAILGMTIGGISLLAFFMLAFAALLGAVL